jgi:mono/diheme cytochrome c family protein
MLKNLLRVLFVIVGVALVFSFGAATSGHYSPYKAASQETRPITEWSVEEALLALGEEPSLHYIPVLDRDSARMGEEMVRFGRLCDGSNKRISKYFYCTDCHNLVKESYDPADESPEAVIEYGKKNKLAFLPAATFYGMYNKEHWYNGDYEKKYGELVAPTRDTLYNAIQLCATQCSQGREMEPWEIRCVMHYYKSIALKIGDLVFTQEEINLLGKAVINNKALASEIIHNHYNEINDATFGTSLIPEIEGYSPNLENGEYMYQYGCLHCHAPTKEITNFDLSMDVLSFKFLEAKLYKYNSFSLSHITRYGTYAISGRKQYMPQYSMENMSDEQMLDLIAYIKFKANE